VLRSSASRVPAVLALIGALSAACADPPAAPPDRGPATASPPPSPPPSPTAAASASAAAPEPSAVAATAASSTADVIAQASPAYAAGPSVIAEARVDGAALRKRHIERLKQDTSAVTVLQGEGPLELGQRICEAVVPKRPAEVPVLLKPNLCGFDSVKDPAKSGGDDGVRGRTTDPEFVRGVVRCLKARGHKRITVAEGCGHSHKHWLELMQLNGYAAMTREEGVGLVAMDDDGVFDTQGDRPGQPLAVSGIGATRVPTLLLPRILAEHLDHGLFISLPKIKAHRYAVTSVAIKNLQGTVMLSDKSPAYKQKWRMHRELNEYIEQRKEKLPEDRKLYVDSLRAFSERMVDVLELSTPDVVLAEGAPAMGGDGFQVLRPSAEKVAIGGTNPVLVDRVAAQFLGLWDNARLAGELGGHRTSPLVESAAKRFKLDLRSVQVVGDGADLLKGPRPVHFKAMAPFAIHFTPAAGARPEAHAAALGGDSITLDGRGDEPAWGRAVAAAWESNTAGEATGIKTRVRFLWSQGALYALFDLSGAGLFTERSRPVGEERQKLYEEDCVEIFLTPDPAAPRRYYEIEIGPFGHFFDLHVDLEAKKYSTGWSSGLRVAAVQRAGAREATLEAEITAPEIKRALVAGARLPLGLFRMEGRSPRHHLAWSPPRTAKPNFHVPEAFGALVLDP